MKTYSSASGFVFQYVFQHSEAWPGKAVFRFQATSDRKTWHPVDVILHQEALDRAASLTSTQQYAVAKLSLFRFFDESAALSGSRSIEPSATNVHDILSELDLL